MTREDKYTSMAVYPIISADGFCSYGERGEE